MLINMCVVRECVLKAVSSDPINFKLIKILLVCVDKCFCFYKWLVVIT